MDKFKKLLKNFATAFQTTSNERSIADGVEQLDKNHSIDLTELTEGVNFAIENNQSDFLFQALKKGYVLNVDQLIGMCSSYTMMINLSFNNDKEIIKEFFFKNHTQMLSDFISEEFQKIKEESVEIKKVIEIKKVTPEQKAKIKKRVENNQAMGFIFSWLTECYEVDLATYHAQNKIIKEMKILLDSVSDDNVIESLLISSFDGLDQHHTKLHGLVGENYLKNQHAPKKIIVPTSQLIKSSSTQEQVVWQSMDLRALPLSTKIAIEGVRKQLSEIDIHQISSEDRFFVKNQIEKNIPKIVAEYASLSAETRALLKTPEGHTMEDLLNQAIKNINEKLKSLSQTQETEKVKQFKVSHRYMTAGKS